MKRSYVMYGVAFLAMAAMSCFLVTNTNAQFGGNAQRFAAAAAKPTPRLPDGHPDLSGFYGVGVAGVNNYGTAATGAEAGGLVKTADGSIFFDYAGAEGGGGHPDDGGNVKQNPNQPPYKPEYMAKVQAIAKTVYGTITSQDPWLECKPGGVPRTSVGGMLHIVANEKFIAILYENEPGPQYRLFYLDGRAHPKDLDTSYMGHSIGHWDGDTLVVDTVGLNDETWYTQTGGANKLTSIHSDKEHVIERWTRKGDELDYQATVEDPVMLTKPWVLPVRRTMIGPADDYIQPQMCNTNDKAHIIQESDKDKFQCNFCQKDADTLYGNGAADRDRDAEKARQQGNGAVDNQGRPAGAGANGPAGQ
jgi:hypothetical protein